MREAEDKILKANVYFYHKGKYIIPFDPRKILSYLIH